MRRLLALLVFVPAIAFGEGVPPPLPVQAHTRRALERACRSGDAAACQDLGQIFVDRYYFVKDGGIPDLERAGKLFERSCALGSQRGCVRLGIHFGTMEGKKADGRANAIFRRACDAGEPSGCAMLGENLCNSQPKEAERLFEQACSGDVAGLGCLSGCNDLWRRYYFGAACGSEYHPPDYPKALATAERACQAGCINSCNEVGDMTREGKGVPQDFAAAARAYQKGCDARFSPSCESLGDLYRAGQGVPRDPAKAKRLLDKACTLSRNQDSECAGRR